MTIARGTASEHESEGAVPRRVFDGRIPAREMLDSDPVPDGIRADRLTRQIENFERAGYQLETRSAFQAVVLKSFAHHRTGLLLAFVTGGLSVLWGAVGARRHHRVAITVDETGSVRFA